MLGWGYNLQRGHLVVGKCLQCKHRCRVLGSWGEKQMKRKKRKIEKAGYLSYDRLCLLSIVSLDCLTGSLQQVYSYFYWSFTVSNNIFWANAIRSGANAVHKTHFSVKRHLGIDIKDLCSRNRNLNRKKLVRNVKLVAYLEGDRYLEWSRKLQFM